MFIFYSKENPTGVRVTVAGQHENGKLKLAASRCSSKDQFSRKIGRSIATGRLNTGHIVNTIEKEVCSVGEFLKEAKIVAKQVEESPKALKK